MAPERQIPYLHYIQEPITDTNYYAPNDQALTSMITNSQ